MAAEFTLYQPRPIRFWEIWRIGEWTLKTYTITLPGEKMAPKLWVAARDIVTAHLKSHATSQTHQGKGFVTVHQGNGENQFNLDRWINENELMHDVWVSPKQASMALAPPPQDHNSVCVWEMYLQSFERHAWIAYVLNNPDGPDFKAYLSARLDEDV